MPATVSQPSAQLIGINIQEWINQTQMMIRPHLKLPIAFGTADAAVLYTIPTLVNGAAAIRLDSAFWEISTSFTGGSSSAIGISSSTTNFTANGSVIGGSGGDVAATLVSTNKYVPGTIGLGFSTGAVTTGKIVMSAGDTIKFNRITSAFTAGTGFLHLDFSFVD